MAHRTRGLTTMLLLALTTLTSSSSAVPSITLSTNTLAKSGDYVTVSWSGVPNPTQFDAVALYFDGVSPDDLRPPRYQWVNQVEGWSQGAGSMKFQVLNERLDVVFHYFSNATPALQEVLLYIEDSPAPVPFFFSSSNIVASSPVLTIANYNEPTQGHLALTAKPGQMLAQWTTRDKGRPMVEWGTASGRYTMSAYGKSQTIKPSDLCGSPANDTGYIWPGNLNYATMHGLAPSTTYYYRYGDKKFGMSPEAMFTTAPPLGPNSTIRLIAWADSGQVAEDGSYAWDWGNDPISISAPDTPQGAFAALYSLYTIDQGQQGASQNLTNFIKKDMPVFQPHLLIHEGDISYARGSTPEWDQFMHQYEDIIKYAPYMTLPGNHERDFVGSNDRYSLLVPRTDSGGECGVVYARRFRMPQPAPMKQWYSFSMGPLHVIQITTEDAFGAGSEQWNFVVNDLKAVDRSVTPWVVVGLHRPIYTSSLYGVEFASDLVVAADLQSAFEEVFYLFEVDMTWAGHVHLYERTCPVFRRQCMGYNADGTAKAPVHLSYGNGGYEFTWFANPFTPDYYEVMAMVHGYNKMTISGTRFHVTHYSTEDGSVIDDFVLTKPAGWKPLGYSARVASLEFFNDNYEPSLLEWPGLSTSAIWGPTFFYAALQAFDNVTLLNQINAAALNTSLIKNPNQQDTVTNLNDVFKIYGMELRNPAVVAASNPLLAQYRAQVWDPLFALFATDKRIWQANGTNTTKY